MQRSWVVSADYRSAVGVVTELRKSLGVSQRELARRLNKPPSFINKIELFERRLDILEFIAIAHALEIQPEKLLRSITDKVSRPSL